MFFHRKHYSTASKIMDLVENKIFNSIKSYPCIKDLFQKYKTELFICAIEDKSKYSNLLGDVLKNEWPSTVYENYQNLDAKEKNEIKEALATVYFDSLDINKKVLNPYNLTAKYRIDSSEIGDVIELKIFLSEKYLNKTSVLQFLNPTIAEARNQIFIAKTDIFQHQNTL